MELSDTVVCLLFELTQAMVVFYAAQEAVTIQTGNTLQIRARCTPPVK